MRASFCLLWAEFQNVSSVNRGLFELSFQGAFSVAEKMVWRSLRASVSIAAEYVPGCRSEDLPDSVLFLKVDEQASWDHQRDAGDVLAGSDAQQRNFELESVGIQLSWFVFSSFCARGERRLCRVEVPLSGGLSNGFANRSE